MRTVMEQGFDKAYTDLDWHAPTRFDLSPPAIPSAPERLSVHFLEQGPHLGG